MAEFDRAALAAAAAGKQNQGGNGLFWGAVIALPVLGLAVGGLLFALPGKPEPPVQISEESAPAPVQAETQTAETEAEPVWSPSSEMDRYTTVRLAMSMCNRHLDYTSFGNTQRAFRERNEADFERLQALRSAEWKAGAGERRRDAQRASNEMMLKVMTGQAQVEALQMHYDMQRQIKEAEASTGQPIVRKTDPRVLNLLGGEPDLKTCSKLNSSLQRRQHDIKFPEQS